MIVRRLTTVLGSAALLALTAAAGPAMADSHTSQDARHDVSTTSRDADPAGPPAVHRREGDVTSLRVTHARHRVRVTMRYRSLHRPLGSHGAFHSFAVKTDERQSYDITVVASPQRPQGDVEFFGGAGETTCRGLRITISYRHDAVRVSVPRRCLSSPRWVRVGGGGGSFSTRSLHGYVDDAQSRTVHRELVLGPRVRRG